MGGASALEQWKGGLSGVSYIAINQWYVAAKQPPALKAIIPGKAWRTSTGTPFSAAVSGSYLATLYMAEFFRDYTVRGWTHQQTKETLSKINLLDFMYIALTMTSGKTDMRLGKVAVPLLSAGNWNGWLGRAICAGTWKDSSVRLHHTKNSAYIRAAIRRILFTRGLHGSAAVL